MQIGVQFHLPTYKDHPVPELVSLAKTAKAAGVSQIWVTDNLQSRNAFVVLAALAVFAAGAGILAAWAAFVAAGVCLVRTGIAHTASQSQ